MFGSGGSVPLSCEKRRKVTAYSITKEKFSRSTPRSGHGCCDCKAAFMTVPYSRRAGIGRPVLALVGYSHRPVPLQVMALPLRSICR